MSRHHLPNRRPATLISIIFRGGRYSIAASRFEDGSLAELFIHPGKTGSDAADDARDIAILISLALQYGVPVETLRHAVGPGLAAEALGAVNEGAQ